MGRNNRLVSDYDGRRRRGVRQPLAAPGIIRRHAAAGIRAVAAAVVKASARDTLCPACRGIGVRQQRIGGGRTISRICECQEGYDAEVSAELGIPIFDPEEVDDA
jgi:hypothetical protein